MKIALTIAGSDSGGGAGIQADLKTFSALGIYGMSVITAVTAQNTTGVTSIEEISPEVVYKQIEAVFSDFTIDVVKIGMVANENITRAIRDGLQKWQVANIVLDPVMVSESGSHLLREEARDALLDMLVPMAGIITPNLYEAAVLLNIKIDSLKTVEDMKAAARDLYQYGAGSILVKGGHLKGEAIDVFYDGNRVYVFTEDRIRTKNTHGTGCTFSSAIASFLAKGYKMPEAIRGAKRYVTEAIRNSLDIGKGPGPTHHFFDFWN